MRATVPNTTVRNCAIVGAALVLIAYGDYHLAGAGLPQSGRAAASTSGALVPQFQFDKTWPKPLPNRMMVGQVAGVSVDTQDHIWIVQRPTSLKAAELEGSELGNYGGQRGPVSSCCRPAPEVIEFDQQGSLVQAWGQQRGMDWPTEAPKSKDNAYGTLNAGERGIFIDYRENVWLGSDGPGDTFLLKLSKFGKPYLSIGKKGTPSTGSNDTAGVNGVSGMVVDPATNEVFVADGARNRRVAVFDAYSGKYLRHWGAYGKKPDDSVKMAPDSPNVDAPQFGDVSAIALSTDKLLYVGDRANNRIQVFKEDGTFVTQGVIAPKTLGGTVFGIALSVEPEQKFVYVADGTNEKIWILDRHSMAVLGSFGSGGHNGGQFTTVYDIATDSKGNLYAGETWEGKRVQRFLYKGLAPAGR
jgi:hypothetical protein